MFSFFVFLLVIVLFGFVIELRSRVAMLEKREGKPQVAPVVAQVATAATVVSQTVVATPVQSVPVQTQTVPQAPYQPNWLDKLVAWLAEDWLLKLGGLLLLIATGWFVSYAFMNDWVGAEGRIALGVMLGVLFYLVGGWRIRSSVHQGGVFLVLGSTTILLTLYAARTYYDFFTPAFALTFMFLSTVVVAGASVLYRQQVLVFAGLVLAGIAPLLTNAPTTDYFGLFGYLLVVVLGMLWVLFVREYHELTLASVVLLLLYSFSGMELSHTIDRPFAFLALQTVFSLVFFGMTTLSIFRRKIVARAVDIVSIFGNIFFLLLWVFLLVSDSNMQSFILGVWMVLFGIFGVYFWKQKAKPSIGVAFCIASLLFLGIITLNQLDGALLTIAFALECTALVFGVSLLSKKASKTFGTAWVFLLPFFLSFYDIISPLWEEQVFLFHRPFLALFVMSVCCLGLGMYFHARTAVDVAWRGIRTLFLLLGNFYAFALLWLSVHAVLLENQTVATMICLGTYTVMGLFTHFYGLAMGRKGLRLYGAVLLGLVIYRLFTVDMAAMELLDRIVTFFLIGVLFMSSAFFGKYAKRVKA